MFGLDEPHPYGVLPYGNLLLVADDEKRLRRRTGLGSMLNAMSDEALVEMLSFLGPQDLAISSRCSRALYVYSHHSDLWRDLTLRLFPDDVVKYRDCWKETFVSTLVRKKEKPPQARHVPLKITGIYSNLLHRSWACHSCDLATACPGFFAHDDVPREEATLLSLTEFVGNYESKNKPVVIRHAVTAWPACNKWTESYIAQAGKDSKFRATSATAPLPAIFTLEEYFNYARQAREEAPLYLFERDFCKLAPSLENDFSVPSYFDPAFAGKSQELSNPVRTHLPAHHTDLFRLFGDQARPDYRWLICGPARSGSIFHIDPNQTNAWNVSVAGRKKWIMYPPGVSPPGVVADAAGAEVTVPISTGEWLLSFWSAHLECRRDPDLRRRPLEVIVEPGELVFVPHGYWHMVLNLDSCIALTQNYVSSSNLCDVLRFLRDTPDQISGVRDRSSEAVQPEEFYDSFLSKLAIELPENVLEVIVQQSKVRSIHEADVLGPTQQARLDVFEVNRRKKMRKRGGGGGGGGEESLPSLAHPSPPLAPEPFTFSFSL